jgi:hypothetical protein
MQITSVNHTDDANLITEGVDSVRGRKISRFPFFVVDSSPLQHNNNQMTLKVSWRHLISHVSLSFLFRRFLSLFDQEKV